MWHVMINMQRNISLLASSRDNTDAEVVMENNGVTRYILSMLPKTDHAEERWELSYYTMTTDHYQSHHTTPSPSQHIHGGMDNMHHHASSCWQGHTVYTAPGEGMETHRENSRPKNMTG